MKADSHSTLSVHYSVLVDYCKGIMNREDRDAFEEMLHDAHHGTLELFRLIPAAEDKFISPSDARALATLKHVQSKMEIHPGWRFTRNLLPNSEKSSSRLAKRIESLCPGIPASELQILFNLFEACSSCIMTDTRIMNHLRRNARKINAACEVSFSPYMSGFDILHDFDSDKCLSILSPAEFMASAGYAHV